MIRHAHPVPDMRKTAGAQSITPKTLKDIMPTLKQIATAVDREI